jgi:outer membrane receptor for ferrienterochelin and colicins
VRAGYSTPKFTVNSGFSYIGRYQQLSETEGNVPEFVFSPEATINASYDFGQSGFKMAAFYKFFGRAKNYQLVANEQNEEIPELLETEAYSFLDATVTKTWNLGITLQAGVRNALDVTSVNNTISGTHSGGTAGQRPISYGRSYFIQLNYRFSK